MMRGWLRRQRSWLVVKSLPGYAPELNPAKPLWSNLKGVELANLAGNTLEEVTVQTFDQTYQGEPDHVL
jgi:hypothetical protein